MSLEEKLLRQASIWLPLLAEQADIEPADTFLTVKAVAKDGSENAIAEICLSTTIAEIKAYVAERNAPKAAA